MKNTITLRNQANIVLYEADHASLREAIEYCIEHNIALDGLMLERENLQAANLDGWNVSKATFKNCNLRHANLSEAILIDCDFSGSDMTDTCLCYSDLLNCIFLDTELAKADLSQAVVISPTFSKKAAKGANFATLHKLHTPICPPYDYAIIHPIIDILKSTTNGILSKAIIFHKNISCSRNNKTRKNNTSCPGIG